MPNFTARIVTGPGLASAVWSDPASVLLPSRINQRNHPHRYLRLSGVGIVQVSATVAGVEGPLDAALGGNLFTSWFDEAPAPLLISVTPGQTSVITFQPAVLGHYVITMRRANGGAVAIPFELQ